MVLLIRAPALWIIPVTGILSEIVHRVISMDLIYLLTGMVFSCQRFSRELENRIGFQVRKQGFSGDNITGLIINYPNGISTIIGHLKNPMRIYQDMYPVSQTAMAASF